MHATYPFHLRFYLPGSRPSPFSTKPAPPSRLLQRCARWLLTGFVGTALLAAHLPGEAQPAPTRSTPSKVRPAPAPQAVGTAPTAALPGRYATHEEAMRFAAALDQQAGWTDGWAARWIGQAQHSPQIVRLMAPAPAGTPKNWAVYRSRFVEPRRLDAGVRFWREHSATLERAQAQFGVPAWLIVGIIGVETLYGQHTGNHRVLDALTTLAFDFPASHPRAAQRTEFFRSELDAFLRMARSSDIGPLDWRGSFAGAMGLPQFMPSNWGRFGVDFDGDGRVDLLNSPADAIGSVARYMQAFGWHTGMPTHYPVSFDEATLDLETLLAPDILPSFSVASMQAKGVRLSGEALNHHGPLALVELENGDPARGGAPRTYVAGTENFYAITRYNWSSYYAMAVIDLGQAVEALWRR